MWDTSRNRKGPIFMDQPPEEPEVQPGSEMRSTFSCYLNWQLLQSIVMRFNIIPVQNILLNVISRLETQALVGKSLNQPSSTGPVAISVNTRLTAH